MEHENIMCSCINTYVIQKASTEILKALTIQKYKTEENTNAITSFNSLKTSEG